MKIYRFPSESELYKILARPMLNGDGVEAAVRDILTDVRANGDAALRAYGRTFDRAEIAEFKVTNSEFDAAERTVPSTLKAAINVAKANIERFHSEAPRSTSIAETSAGIYCWRQEVSIEKVGLYIPAGSAPLFSTVLMLAIPANLAGCSQVIAVSPPRPDGTVDPATLYAARLCGVTSFYKVGGAQAIAALAYGTETIPAVYKIFGPGNSYVTEAKLQIMRSGVAIDMPAGPSELAVIADDSADPTFVAADLLSQAEHGADSQVLLISFSHGFIEKCLDEMDRQIASLPRQDIARTALENSSAVLVRDSTEALYIANRYAPEHLIIATRDADELSSSVKNAGSVFVGNYSCESAGDYASGPNHTLPTGGAARAYSGLSVASFMKTITFQKLTREGLGALGPSIETLANAEGLEGHKNAVAVRLDAIRRENGI